MTSALGALARMRRFTSCDDGSSTIEFVLWVPMLVATGVAMFALSAYVATVSEVQQVAHELTRSSISLVKGGFLKGDLCRALNDDVLPKVTQNMAMLHVERFAHISDCPLMPDKDNVVTLTVRYNMGGSTLDTLGRSIGVAFGTVTRTSSIQL